MALLTKQNGATARPITRAPQVRTVEVFVAGAVVAFGLSCGSPSFAAAPACGPQDPIDPTPNPAADHSFKPGTGPGPGGELLVRYSFPPKSTDKIGGDWWDRASNSGSYRVAIIYGPGRLARLPPSMAVFYARGPLLIESSMGVYSPGMRFRFEACDAATGKWVPITTPALKSTLSVIPGRNGRPDATTLSEIHATTQADAELAEAADAAPLKPMGGFWGPGQGPPLPKPSPTSPNEDDPTKIPFLFTVQWVPPQVALKVDGGHSCNGVPGVFQVATNYGRASTSVHGPDGDEPYPMAALAVAMRYNGNFQAGLNGHDQLIEGGNGPIHLNTGPGVVGQGDSISPFPYGAPISKTVRDANFVEVSDQLRGGGPGVSVCSGFSVLGVAQTYDGRMIRAQAHSN